MDNEAAARLKFDRRLASRRSWVDPEELANELGSLADCTDKIQPAESSEPPAASPPSPEPTTPTDPDFGGGNPET